MEVNGLQNCLVTNNLQMTIFIFGLTITFNLFVESIFVSYYSKSDLVHINHVTFTTFSSSMGWWEVDMIYVCRVKATWFMSAVMLRFLLPVVICISELWHDSSLTGIQLSGQQRRHPITNTVCHTERGKVQKRWGEEMKESKKKEWQRVRLRKMKRWD